MKETEVKSTTVPSNESNPRKVSLQRGMLLGSASVFLSILAASVTFPFLQAQRDNLGCDALCYGSMQSVRSGLSLIGNVLVTRLSDKTGRQIALWIGILASLVSYLINYMGTSIEAMWIAMIPIYLLNQNFSVLKALFADYNNEISGSEAERANSMGRLGMAVGISFMIGPTIGATFLKDYYEATALACLLTMCSGILLLILPPAADAKTSSSSSAPSHNKIKIQTINSINSSAFLNTMSTTNADTTAADDAVNTNTTPETASPSLSGDEDSDNDNDINNNNNVDGSTVNGNKLTNRKKKTASNTTTPTKSNTTTTATPSTPSSSSKRMSDTIKNGWSSLLSLFHLPVAQTAGAKLLFFMRCGMALAFSIFMTVWTVTLKERFAFGAKDHAYFMGWIGLCYAVSQGVLARFLIQTFGGKDGDPTFLLLACMVLLSLGRVLAMQTHSVMWVYIIMAAVIVALGVVNTSISSACATLATTDQVGGLFGILEALESLAGLFGPAAGGLLYKYHVQAPLVAVVMIYGCIFIAIFLFYKSSIVLSRHHHHHGHHSKSSSSSSSSPSKSKSKGSADRSISPSKLSNGHKKSD